MKTKIQPYNERNCIVHLDYYFIFHFTLSLQLVVELLVILLLITLSLISTVFIFSLYNVFVGILAWFIVLNESKTAATPKLK